MIVGRVKVRRLHEFRHSSFLWRFLDHQLRRIRSSCQLPLRDEATSYAYPPGDEVLGDEALLIELEAIFDKHNIEHIHTSLDDCTSFIEK